MNKDRKGVIIEGRAREMILKVTEYFEDEKNRSRLLLQRLTVLSQQNNLEAKVPIDIFTDVVEYLKSTAQVTKRVAAATNINKNTLTRIRNEGAIAKANNAKIITPVRKRRGKKDFFNHDEKGKLLDIIISNFGGKKQEINFRTLLLIVRRDLNYTGSVNTLRRIMLDMGFQWKKQPGSSVAILTEMPASVEIDCAPVPDQIYLEKTQEGVENIKKEYDSEPEIEVYEDPGCQYNKPIVQSQNQAM